MTDSRNVSRTTTVGAILGGLLLGAAPLAAQDTAADTRWQPWLGCWQAAVAPTPRTPLDAAAMAPIPRFDPKAPVLCVVPAAGASAVDLVTVADGKVIDREHVDANSTPRNVTRDGCTGWETAGWAANAHRVYVRSEMSCAGNITRKTSGMLAVATTGELLDVREIMAGAQTGVRVARFRQLGDSVALPPELASARRDGGMAAATARLAAGAPITTGDIAEAAHHVDAPAVEAWLAERGETLRIDAKQLTALADAGVPGRITDVLVALAHPQTFALTRSGQPTELDDARIAEYGGGRTIPVYLDPFGYGYASGFGYGLSSLGYGYGNGYGYGYGNGYGWYGGNTGVIVIVKDPGSATPKGRAVNGHGYTRGNGTSGGGIATPRGDVSGGSSSSSGSGSKPADSGSSGRTAKPRP